MTSKDEKSSLLEPRDASGRRRGFNDTGGGESPADKERRKERAKEREMEREKRRLERQMRRTKGTKGKEDQDSIKLQTLSAKETKGIPKETTKAKKPTNVEEDEFGFEFGKGREKSEKKEPKVAEPPKKDTTKAKNAAPAEPQKVDAVPSGIDNGGSSQTKPKNYDQEEDSYKDKGRDDDNYSDDRDSDRRGNDRGKYDDEDDDYYGRDSYDRKGGERREDDDDGYSGYYQRDDRRRSDDWDDRDRGDRDWDSRDDDYYDDRRDYEKGRGYGSTKDWDRDGLPIEDIPPRTGVMGVVDRIFRPVLHFFEDISDAITGRRPGDEEWETKERRKIECLHMAGICGIGTMVVLFILTVILFVMFFFINCRDVFWVPSGYQFCIRIW